MVFVLRFIDFAKKQKVEKHIEPTVEELKVAELVLFKLVQSEVFTKDQQTIYGLKVQKDSDGIIRVKTRLFHRDDSVGFRFPVVLPNCHLIVDMLVMDAHLKNSHGGAQFLMALLREKVWIIHGRKTIKKVLRTCVRCRRFEARKYEVPSCSLPKNRVQGSTAFCTTGIDLAGPLTLKNGNKVYFVIFTCAVYRAVHLEITDSLSTEDFILAFIRFSKRMCRPDIVYSDNGKNFVGAQNLFSTINWNRVEREFKKQKIKWVFNPPSAPWWGGFWERLIRSVKDLLKRMLGFGKMNRAELETCLCQAEWVVNNRPLNFVTEDQDDLTPLTPAMFLHGMTGGEIPEADLVSIESLRGRKKKMKTLFQDLQDRFRSEYLGALVQRGREKTRTFEVGEIVLVESENKKRILWPMAKIIELIPGKDGVVRVARLKKKSGEFLRPIQRLFPLEVDTTEVSKVRNLDKIREEKETSNAETVQPKMTKSGRLVKPSIRFCDY